MNQGGAQRHSNEIRFDDLTVQIKEIDETCNVDMLAIMDRCPMESKRITLSTDRHPDIFHLPKFYYDSFQYFGFFVGDELLGFALLAIKRSLINGEMQPVFHFTDFYLVKKLRRRNLYIQSTPYIYAQLPVDCKIGYGIFIEGNIPVQTFVKKTSQKMSGIPSTQVIAKLNVYTLFLMFNKKVRLKYEVRQARRNDLDRVVELLSREHENRLFGKLITKGSVMDELETTPGLSLENYYVAVKDSEVLGVISAWDTSSFNRIRIVKYGRLLKTIKRLHSIAARLFGFRPLPDEGQHMNGVYLRDIAIEGRDPKILEALLVHVHNYYCKSDKDVIYCGMVNGDPLEEAFKGFMHEVVSSEMAVGVFEPLNFKDLNMHNPFVEYGVL